MHGMFLDLDREKRTRVPFTTAQLNSLFKSPLYLKCAGDKREHESGSVRVRDWRYWIPLIGLYSGARLGEIAQLLVGDLREIHGTWVFISRAKDRGMPFSRSQAHRGGICSREPMLHESNQ